VEVVKASKHRRPGSYMWPWVGEGVGGINEWLGRYMAL
jgi:hypothetical protein